MEWWELCSVAVVGAGVAFVDNDVGGDVGGDDERKVCGCSVWEKMTVLRFNLICSF